MYNNCYFVLYLLSIQICPPGLHITLGLWNKFYSNLEAELQELGQLIAENKVEQVCRICGLSIYF